MDSSSIEVSRRKRRAKTDRLDAHKLLGLLIRWGVGAERPFSVVAVPSEEEEDERRLHRERERLLKERAAHSNRIRSLLATQGVAWEKGSRKDVGQRRRWDGAELPAGLRAEVARESRRLAAVLEQLKELEAEQRQRLSEAQGQVYEWMRQLRRLRAIDVQCSWVLVREIFGWRRFRNRRELAGCVGLAPTPWSSGEEAREQGIGKAGNRRCRALMVELAWMWLRYQSASQLSQWYGRRFAQGGKRLRRIGIVALARKLLVALWRYLQTGELPAGAQLKAA